MKFIKTHWKEILLVIFIIFSLNKCTVACNRDTKITKQALELAQKDSIIQQKTDSLNILNIRWSDAQTSQSTYQGIALGNQQELLNQIDELTKVKETLEIKINALTAQNNQLKKENQKLSQVLNSK